VTGGGRCRIRVVTEEPTGSALRRRIHGEVWRKYRPISVLHRWGGFLSCHFHPSSWHWQESQ